MFKQSLRAKLIAPFLIATLLLTCSLAWYTYTSARKSMIDAILLISEAKSANVVGSIGLLAKSASTGLQNMVAEAHVTSVLAADAAPDAAEKAGVWLETVTLGNEYYRDVLVLDKNGICVASSNPGSVGHSYISQEYVQHALQGAFTMGDLSVGRVTKKFSATFAGPIDVSGEVAGALIIINDFPKIVDYDEKKAFDNRTVFTALLTPKGQFIAHKDKKVMGNAKKLYPDLYDLLAEETEQGGDVVYVLEGESYIGYAQVDPISKWVVVTSGMQKDVFAPAFRTGLTVLGISFLFLALIFFVVFRFANGILSTLLSLINYAKHVSEGDFSHRLEESKREDELGVLHESLQRLVEALQRMLQEMEKASTMKGQFLANMSHEMRTPLNAIIGMTHLALRDETMSEKQRSYVDKMQTAARSLLGLINDILDLSKVEAGMFDLENAPLNLRDNVQSLLDIHRDGASEKGLQLELSYLDDVPEYFVGDSLRIGQVLNNILSNAIKFTSSGGITVTVACEGASPQTGLGEPVRDVIHVSVADTGIGMSEDVLKNLFQPFTQADASISRQYGGTGLGLAISNKLVELMGGTFSVTSRPGEGTTFSFTLMLQPDPEGKNRNEAGQSPDKGIEALNLHGKRILVAEDNAINQLIMQELLAPSGATVLIANNGEEAVLAAKKHTLDLVFMDMQMPVMDGLEATRLIRTFTDMGTLPIIAVTANAMKEDKERGVAMGMNDYITKPVEPQHLLDMLRVWLGKR